MSDPIPLHGQKQTIEQVLHNTNGTPVPINITLQGIRGILQISSSAERRASLLEGADGYLAETSQQDPHADFFQQLIEEEEELEIEVLDPIDFVVEAFQPGLEPFALLSFENTDEEYHFAMPVVDEDGLLFWEFGNQQEVDQVRFELGIRHFGNLTETLPEGVPQGRRRFRPFRWLKNRVGKSFTKETIFKRLRFEPGLPKKSIWEPMRKEGDWSFLKPATQPGKKALLLIHGFIGGPKNYDDFVEGEVLPLEKLYEDRIFIFQHSTLWHDVGENTQAFFDLWKGEPDLQLDVITRSRGSLVFRQIVEANPNQQWTNLKVKLGNIVMLAGPNEGTPLAKPGNLDIYIRILTNLASVTQIGRTVIGLSWLIRLIKGRRVINWQHRLRGLYSMSPDSEFVKEVNKLAIDRPNYHSVSVNSDPDTSLRKIILEKLVDPIFKGMENDLINPTHGAYGALDGMDAFEIAKVNTNFDGKKIDHLNYFKHDIIRNQIVFWLETLDS